MVLSRANSARATVARTGIASGRVRTLHRIGSREYGQIVTEAPTKERNNGTRRRDVGEEFSTATCERRRIFLILFFFSFHSFVRRQLRAPSISLLSLCCYCYYYCYHYCYSIRARLAAETRGVRIACAARDHRPPPDTGVTCRGFRGSATGWRRGREVVGTTCLYVGNERRQNDAFVRDQRAVDPRSDYRQRAQGHEISRHAGA